MTDEKKEKQEKKPSEKTIKKLIEESSGPKSKRKGRTGAIRKRLRK